MTVRKILEEKGRDVFTMDPDATLVEAAKAMAQKRIGAIVLLDEAGDLAGVLSERDIVRVVGTRGADCLGERIASVMTVEVVTCSEDTTVNEVMEIMTRGRFRHLPVIQAGKLTGMVSIGDIVKRRIEDAEREAEEMRSYISTSV
ncbi:inosine-5-monophosphate dehydrogenase [Aureimonas sp. SA4125]|uniref:CBS domain-containing protein n=1 Tax=Aureimonas sp. SA4125 TaxID=2826993 RepID=UPI001CC654B7|nr:CBS domain-containing protein [Aureimonas sp. SA4125]BDA84922.1 inosine-5-monophosphate dehydrogenase [Aureimonas sp. SA4125]